MPFTITSTYDEYAPAFDDHPNGRTWEGQFPDYLSAWLAVEAYLLQQQWFHLLPSDPDDERVMALAPFGHEEPTFFFGDTTAINDAETITITETPA